MYEQNKLHLATAISKTYMKLFLTDFAQKKQSRAEQSRAEQSRAELVLKQS